MCAHIVTLAPDELRAAQALFGGAMHQGPAGDDSWAWVERSYAAGRTIGVREDGRVVATATSFPARITVPGGAALPAAAVTRVGVRADRTRRGLLTAMMRSQLADVAGRGEVLASLRASEARIYGRFGYGVASRARNVTVRARGGSGWRAGAPSGGRVWMPTRDDAVDVLAGVYEGIAGHRTGGMTRPAGWWSLQLGRRLAQREPVVVAVHAGTGGDDGFAIAIPDEDGHRVSTSLRVLDLQAGDTAATAGLWRFLLGVDLVRDVHGWMRPLDEALELLLADPRDATTTGLVDETWLRLVDVPAALAGRGWAGAAAVPLAVHDPVLPGNTGTYRIGRGGAERVTGTEPRLGCGVDALAMAYLGDRTPSELVAGGWWWAADADAARCADAVFRTAEAPWCGTFF